MLSGYKTYIVGGLAVLGALGGWLDGNLTWMAALQLAIPAILAMTVRNGVQNQTATMAATVVQAVVNNTPPSLGVVASHPPSAAVIAAAANPQNASAIIAAAKAGTF